MACFVLELQQQIIFKKALTYFHIYHLRLSVRKKSVYFKSLFCFSFLSLPFSLTLFRINNVIKKSQPVSKKENYQKHDLYTMVQTPHHYLMNYTFL